MWRVFYLPPVVTFWLFLTGFGTTILAVSTANRGYPVKLMVRLLRAVLGRGQRRRKPSDSTLGTKRQNVFQPRPPFMDLSVSLTSVKDRKRPRSNFKIQVGAQLAPIFARISISKFNHESAAPNYVIVLHIGHFGVDTGNLYFNISRPSWCCVMILVGFNPTFVFFGDF